MDGVCCNSEECGECQACNIGSSKGYCSTVYNGTDDTCNGNAACNEFGSCDCTLDGGYFGKKCAVCTAPGGTYDQAHEDDCKFTDPRDGNVYYVAYMGDNMWFRQNLRIYAPEVKVRESRPAPEICGFGYTWEIAKMACPEGWHLPIDEEFNLLFADACSQVSGDDCKKPF